MPKKPKEKYPEHEKLAKVQDKSQAVGEFVEWLQSEKDVVLARYEEGERRGTQELLPIHDRLVSLLAEHFGIDEKRLESEKEAMLEECRRAHG